MLSFFKRQASRGFSHLTRLANERNQSFTIWDKILLAASTATSVVLKRSPWLILANISVMGVWVLLPRPRGYITDGETQPLYADRIHTAIDEILKRAEQFNKPLKRPARIVFKDQHLSSVKMYAATTGENEHVLIVVGNVSLVSEDALRIMIEHELSHMQLGDTKVLDYPDRMFIMGSLFASLGAHSNPLSSFSWMGVLYILKQTSLRYRESRADHYAVQDSAHFADVNPDKVKALEDMVTQLEEFRGAEENLVVADVAAQSYTKQADIFIHKCCSNPNTFWEHMTNLGLNLISTHPTASRRVKI